jgi:hypothetical protein
VDRGGAVYKCSVDSPDACQQIAFDRSGNYYFKNIFIVTITQICNNFDHL